MQEVIVLGLFVFVVGWLIKRYNPFKKETGCGSCDFNPEKAE